MYYFAKIAQASGLTIVLIGYLTAFPELMNRKLLTMGLIVFGFGWLMERYLLKK